MTAQLESIAHHLVDNGPAAGCMFVVVTPEGTFAVPRVSPESDGFEVARLMLGEHLYHIQQTMERMGVERDLEDVARQAVEEYRDHERGSDDA